MYTQEKNAQNILITFTTTAGFLAFATHLFLNSILDIFGLAVTSAETLTKLRASQRIVETIKERHTHKVFLPELPHAAMNPTPGDL
jgi:hypothetical protein